MENSATLTDEDDRLKVLLYYYYYYVEEEALRGTAREVDDESQFHGSLCRQLKLGGRVRVAEEGFNGVLSGRESDLRGYIKAVEERGIQNKWFQRSGGEETAKIDWKWGEMRSDLRGEDQIFVGDCKVDVVKEVVSLGSGGMNSGEGASAIPNIHLDASQWHSALLSPAPSTVFLDTRNCYESAIGFFASSSPEENPTILCNTRKFASLPRFWDGMKESLSGKNVLMYCTGGVRCEVASKSLIQWSEANGVGIKSVGQLKGGICRYLESYPGRDPDSGSLYRGKNFVFDNRRFDPNAGKGIVGRCCVCDTQHDDYDNAAPMKEKNEARCRRCRILLLICRECRKDRITWGEKVEDGTEKAELFCGPGGAECVDMGNKVDDFKVVVN